MLCIALLYSTEKTFLALLQEATPTLDDNSLFSSSGSLSPVPSDLEHEDAVSLQKHMFFYYIYIKNTSQ